jgi:hypothetical protein
MTILKRDQQNSIVLMDNGQAKNRDNVAISNDRDGVIVIDDEPKEMKSKPARKIYQLVRPMNTRWSSSLYAARRLL